MKFFKKKSTKQQLYIVNTNIFLNKGLSVKTFTESHPLNKFSLRKGKGLKSKLQLGTIIENIHYFIFFKKVFLINNYPMLNSTLQNFLEKKLNFNFLLSSVVNLIKSPFIVKAVSIPKKLKKRTKAKFLVKIIYSSENKRVKNSYKQLYYYSNNFLDSKFSVRLYKTLIFSFLEWKNSHLFKLKTAVFKKFFKF